MVKSAKLIRDMELYLCGQHSRPVRMENIITTKIGWLVVFRAEQMTSGPFTVGEQQRAAHVGKTNGKFHTFNDIILA
jgi:hypothetical protein